MRVSANWLGMPSPDAKMFVAMSPGQMQLTRILSAASWAAVTFVMWMMAALAIE